MVPSRRTYAGLFLVTLSTLMYEILLTRVFSVAMWYHFVFLAISIVMFGLTVGGLLVYLAPSHFPPANVHLHLATTALCFALSIVASFILFLAGPLSFQLSVEWITVIVLTLLVVSIPFVFSGICVCLALTRFPRQVGRLYAADLGGAAAGCILVVYALRFFDAPSAVILAAALGALGAFCFWPHESLGKFRWLALACAVLLGTFAGVNTLLARKLAAPLRLVWIRGIDSPPPVYEKWNSFSRVLIYGAPSVSEAPTTWGLSTAHADNERVHQLHLLIDSGAATVLTNFHGDFRGYNYLKYDITNFVHYLRPESRVVVIGAGGGRDVLSALAFGQKSVVAIEMNEGILRALNQTFGEFTGHLDRDPRVSFVHDEARSYLARSKQSADIIQASLIDTAAATAGGAFALTENSIYTVEAWQLFLERLTPRGVLSFTRWDYLNNPAEVYKLVAVATTALRRRNVSDPRGHIVLVRFLYPHKSPEQPDGLATILVSRQAFSAEDLQTVNQVAGRMKFDVILSPTEAADSTLQALAWGESMTPASPQWPENLSLPTDNSPFFFCNFRVRDVFGQFVHGWHPVDPQSSTALFTLASLLVGVTVVTGLCIVAPLLLTLGKGFPPSAIPLSGFFAAIGLGFMLVEVSQLERLMVFLGHPTYSLSTVLFTLLLSSGLGSYSTGAPRVQRLLGGPVRRLSTLLIALVLFGLLTPLATAAFAASATPVRLAAAAAILFPLGFFMGMAFPIGMQLASARAEALTPWLWGLNGATSVMASVWAFLIALGWGISTAFWTGAACYAIAALTCVWISAQAPRRA